MPRINSRETELDKSLSPVRRGDGIMYVGIEYFLGPNYKNFLHAAPRAITILYWIRDFVFEGGGEVLFPPPF